MDDKHQESTEISTGSIDERAIIKEYLVKLQELRNKYEGQQKKLINQENSLKQDIKRKNNEIQQLERKIEQLAKENNESTKRIGASTRLPPVMQQKREQCLARRDELKIIYPLYVKIVLGYIRFELCCILKCPATEKVHEENADTRETYKVYGLLLSACGLRKRDPEPARSIVNQVVKYTQDKFTYKRSETHIIEDYVVKAVTLTHNMLTLLPPLLITTEIKKYNEAMHDVNRATWNDAIKRKECLIYYRPILVDGNQLHIAEKGLVGNKIEEEPKKQQHQQKLQQLGLKKESKEHRQIEKQHQQSQEAINYCAACKKALHCDEGGTPNYIYRLGLFWHKYHCKCTSCHKEVDGDFMYFEDSDLVYCNQCLCAKCKEPLYDEVMNGKLQNDVKCSSV